MPKVKVRWAAYAAAVLVVVLQVFADPSVVETLAPLVPVLVAYVKGDANGE